MNFFVLIILTVLSAFIITSIFVVNRRVSDSLNNLNRRSHRHDAIGDFSHLKANFQDQKPKVIDQTVLKQQALVQIADQMGYAHHPAFTYNRIATRTFDMQNGTKTIKLVGWNQRQTIDQLIITKGTGLTNTSTWNPDPFLATVRAKADSSIVLNQQFAIKNQIHLGDVIRLLPDKIGDRLLVKRDLRLLQTKKFANDGAFNRWRQQSIYKNYYWYFVSGFGISSDFVTPLLNQRTILPNKTNQGIGYIANDQFGLYRRDVNGNQQSADHKYWKLQSESQILVPLSTFNNETYYVFKFSSIFLQHESQATGINSINRLLLSAHGFTVEEGGHHYHIRFNSFGSGNSGNSGQFVYLWNDHHYRFYMRTNLLPKVIISFNAISIVILIIVGFITGIVVLMVVGKEIENTRKQMGILKALGCDKWSLIIPYCIYPLVISFLGGMFGFILGVILESSVINLFGNYFNIDYRTVFFPFISLIFSVVSFLVVMAFFVLFYAFLLLRNQPLYLLSNVDWSNTSSRGFGFFLLKVVTKITLPRRSFQSQLKFSFFVSSQGKISLIFFTMLLGSFLFGLSVIGPKVLTDLKADFYAGENYQFAVYERPPVWNNPATFYRTFDPTQQPWRATPDKQRPTKMRYLPNLQTLMQSLLAHQNNVSYLNPNINVLSQDLTNNSLSNLTGEVLDKTFFKKYDRYGSTPLPSFVPVIMELTWPDYNNLVLLTKPRGILSPFWNNLSGWPDGTWKLKYFDPSQVTTEQIEQMYHQLRKFYLNYRETVDMTLNTKLLKLLHVRQDLLKHGTGTITSRDIKWDTGPFPSSPRFKTGYFFVEVKGAKNQIHDLTLNDFHLATREDEAISQNATFRDLKKNVFPEDPNLYLQDMMNWIGLLFINRVAVGIVQGTFSRAPYYVRQSMLRAFQKEASNYYLGFNAIPFHKETDYLGTYVPLNINHYGFNLYGLTANQNKISLTNNQGYNLLPLLFRKKSSCDAIPIVVNETVAKKLDLHLDGTVPGQVLRYVLGGKLKDHNHDHQQFFIGDDLTKWDFSHTQIGQPGDDTYGYADQSASFNRLQYQYRKDKNKPSSPFQMQIPSGPSDMTFASNSGEVQNQTDNINQLQFQIVGLTENYGRPQGYVAQTTANFLMGYDKAEQMLYRDFYNNWQPASLKNIHEYDHVSPAYQKILDQIAQSHGKLSFLQSTIKPPATVKATKAALTLFENDFPIFNYKLSTNPQLVDITDAQITSQPYGDFTLFGLNGGYDTTSKIHFPLLGINSIANLGGQQMTKPLLSQLIALLYIFMIFFIVISLLISISVILMASNLIIKENKVNIMTLKTLGYNDWEIVNLVTSSYIYLLVIAFGLAFTGSWYTSRYLVHLLAQNTIWVLPLNFVFWLPLVAFGTMLLVYFSAFISSWYHLKHYKAIDVLKQMM